MQYFVTKIYEGLLFFHFKWEGWNSSLKDGIWQPGSSIRLNQGVPNSQTHGKQLPKYFDIYVYFLSTFDAVTRRSPDGQKLVNVVSE